MKGLTVVDSTRMPIEKKTFDGEVVVEDSAPSGELTVSGADKLLGVAADNFGRILNIAEEIVSIKKMHQQTDDTIRLLAAQRENLITEANIYIEKLNADTNATVTKMDKVHQLMESYYRAKATTNITPEEFGQMIDIIMEKIK